MVKHNISNNDTFTKTLTIVFTILLSSSILSGLLLVSFTSSAEATSSVDDISIATPVVCGISDSSNSTDTPHTASINPGQYKEDIGTTTFKVFCNDNTGYALYAIGYSNEEYGNTNLLPTNTSNPSIATGLAISGNTSSWAMKLTPVTEQSSGSPQPYVPTIESDTNGSFANYHIVPEEYTKVATFTSTTDFTIGSSLTSTYRIYIHDLQPADTYNGEVKYTLVHPNDGPAPFVPVNIQNAAVKDVIDDNVMINNEFYALQEQTVAALKASPNMPEEYKQYLKTTEVKGHPKCTRAELVNRIKATTTLSAKEESAILNDDTVTIQGTPVDLRVFDKDVDGIYAQNVKIRLFEPSAAAAHYEEDEWGWEDLVFDDYSAAFLQQVMQSDVFSFFDFEAFNEATSVDDFNSVNKYSQVRNIQTPSFTFEAIAENSADVKMPITADITAVDRNRSSCNLSPCEIIDVDIKIDIQTSVSVEKDDVTGEAIAVWGEMPNNPESVSITMLGRQYEDIDDIIDSYVNAIRSFISNAVAGSTIMIAHEGVIYQGDDLFHKDSLTEEDILNLISEQLDGYDVCSSYNLICSHENLEAAKAKLEF